jgi:hypothetical protein
MTKPTEAPSRRPRRTPGIVFGWYSAPTPTERRVFSIQRCSHSGFKRLVTMVIGIPAMAPAAAMSSQLARWAEQNRAPLPLSLAAFQFS